MYISLSPEGGAHALTVLSSHSLSRKLTLASLLVVAAATVGLAQVNILSDVINFRTSSDQDETTTHYGKLQAFADANSVGTVIDATTVSTSQNDGVAVRGTSVPIAFYGIGGKFTGGYHGVEGWCTVSGTGSRVGGYFEGRNGSSGNYGIAAFASGGTTNYAGYFGGPIYVNGTVYPTDEKLKLNERGVEGALPKLMQLKPKSYDYDTSSYRAMNLPGGTQTGFVAQDVEKVLPELVIEVTPPPSREEGTAQPESFKGLNYTGMIPMLVAAMQEQQATIEEQNRRIEQLEARVR